MTEDVDDDPDVYDRDECCRICGDRLERLDSVRAGTCIDCRDEYIGDHRAGRYIADGSGCFYCSGDTDYHPTCDRPGCERQTHGFDEDGTTTRSYCPPHRGAVATDGGVDVCALSWCFSEDDVELGYCDSHKLFRDRAGADVGGGGPA